MMKRKKKSSPENEAKAFLFGKLLLENMERKRMFSTDLFPVLKACKMEHV